MRYFDKHPNRFRALFILLTAASLVLSFTGIYRYASTSTDENVFIDIGIRNAAGADVTELYIVAETEGVLKQKKGETTPGKIHVGDYLMRIDGKRVYSVDSAHVMLSNANGADVELRVFSIDGQQLKDYLVPRQTIPKPFVQNFGRGVGVTAVTPGGASDRAGLKVGDVIIRINGKSFNGSAEADLVMRETQSGRTSTYEIVRGGETQSLNLVLAALGMPTGVILFILSGLIFFGTGVFLGVARPNLIGARILSNTFLTTGFFMMLFFVRRGVLPDLFENLLTILTVAALYLFFPLNIHAGHYFPKERPELIGKRWVLRNAYLLSAVLFLITVSAAIATRPLVVQGLIILLILLCIVILSGYQIFIWVNFRKQASEEYRRLNAIPKNTSILVSAAAILIVILMILVNGQRFLGYLGVLLIFIPLSFMYTIGRYRLLDMELRVRRNIQYVIVSFCWSIVLLVASIVLLAWLQDRQFQIPNIQISLTSIELLDAPITPERKIWFEKGVLMLAAVLVMVSAWRVWKLGQRSIDTMFYHVRYDYRRAANELAEVMATKLSMVDLARGMGEKIAQLLQLKSVGVLFFRDEKVCCCQEVHGFSANAWKEYCVAKGADLAKQLQPFHGGVSTEYLPAEWKEEMKRFGFHYILPIQSKNHLIGAVVVGEKRSEATYTHEDLEFLSAVAKQASVAIENAFLYEELAEQERMKHELALARRIQMASLPQNTPKIQGLDISGISAPAMEVGGDYFDYLNGIPDRFTVIVGDVSGKGTSAALYLSKVQGIFRSLYAFNLSPKELFIRTNKLLCNDLEKNSFITAVGGFFHLDKKEVILTRAGHLPVYHYSAATQRIEKIIPKGLGLGLESDRLFAEELEERIVPYRPNDVFLLVSDGVTDAERSDGAQFGEEQLVSTLHAAAARPAEEIRDYIISEVRVFMQGNDQNDDQTVVVVKATQ
ncbi:MAG: SpoIIE family protein phosphatase [bacterium]